MTVSANDIRSFNTQVYSFVKDKLPAEAVKFHTEICLAVLRGVIFKTPVDTGTARGGWKLGVNYIPRGGAGTGEAARDPGGGSTFAKGQAKLSTLKPFSIVYIVNNVHYIVYLEKGSSQQAPQGMLAQTMQEVSAYAGRK
jgi:hypothetical protein